MITAVALEGLPEITPGADLGELISKVLASGPAPEQLRSGDVLVIAHKVVSKAEGRVRSLADVVPGERALELAAPVTGTPRHVQVVLDESREVVGLRPG